MGGQPLAQLLCGKQKVEAHVSGSGRAATVELSFPGERQRWLAGWRRSQMLMRLAQFRDFIRRQRKTAGEQGSPLIEVFHQFRSLNCVHS